MTFVRSHQFHLARGVGRCLESDEGAFASDVRTVDVGRVLGSYVEMESLLAVCLDYGFTPDPAKQQRVWIGGSLLAPMLPDYRATDVGLPFCASGLLG